jgi:hypothetical protein
MLCHDWPVDVEVQDRRRDSEITWSTVPGSLDLRAWFSSNPP